MYAVTFDPSVTFIIYLMVIIPISQLFGWIGNQFISRFELFAGAVYDVKWYNMSIGHQKKLQMVLIMAQNMKAFNGVFSSEVNMETFQKV